MWWPIPMIFCGTCGWMSSQWSVWYLPLWFSLVLVGGCAACGQCGTYLHDFLWRVGRCPVHDQCGTYFHDFIWHVGGCPLHGQCGTYFHDFIGHVGGCPTHGQHGTYLHDFLWHVWVDVQHVVSVVLTSMISLASGWMSRAWSVWYLPPWFVFLARVSGSPVCGQCGTYLRDFLWHMWVVVQQAVSVVTKHHQHVWGHFGHLLVHTLKQSPS